MTEEKLYWYHIKAMEQCQEAWELSQMATYWFVIDGLDIQKAQKSEARQVAKDIVKSKV